MEYNVVITVSILAGVKLHSGSSVAGLFVQYFNKTLLLQNMPHSVDTYKNSAMLLTIKNNYMVTYLIITMAS